MIYERNQKWHSLAFYFEDNSRLRFEAETTAFIKVPLNAPFSSSLMPAIVVPAGDVTSSLSWAGCFFELIAIAAAPRTYGTVIISVFEALKTLTATKIKTLISYGMAVPQNWIKNIQFAKLVPWPDPVEDLRQPLHQPKPLLQDIYRLDHCH